MENGDINLAYVSNMNFRNYEGNEIGMWFIVLMHIDAALK